MSDHNDECFNCGRYIGLDEHFTEERNDYGIPVPICDQCTNKDLGNYLPKSYC